MKKFLAVFDGYKMSKSTLEYAIQFTKAVEAHLVGVFLNDLLYRNYNVKEVITRGKNYEEEMKTLDEKDKTKREVAARQFQRRCGKARINFSIHRDDSIAIQELKRESMFADLIIINVNETFTRYKEEAPTRFMKDLLNDVQCPLLVVGNTFKTIDNIVLLYDGRPASLYAIKMFSYLFGNFRGVPVEVFTVKDAQEPTIRIPGDKLMKEFINRHFPTAEYQVEKGVAEQRIVGHLAGRSENELVVLGAYQRSELSRLFKPSIADILMKEVDTPLFIAHNK